MNRGAGTQEHDIGAFYSKVLEPLWSVPKVFWSLRVWKIVFHCGILKIIANEDRILAGQPVAGASFIVGEYVLWTEGRIGNSTSGRFAAVRV